MAQQSASRGRKNQTESVYFEHVNLMWFRSANSHTGQQLTLHYRPDRWQHPTTCQNFQIPLATEGASTDGSFPLGQGNRTSPLERGNGSYIPVMPDSIRHPASSHRPKKRDPGAKPG